jgi:hypothetical protein
MTRSNLPNFATRRLHSYPVGAIVGVKMVSGREIEGQIVRIEITAAGVFHHVEFGEEVATITRRQIIGFYDFCFIWSWAINRHLAKLRCESWLR